MFGLLTIDEGPPLSMTAGRAVAQLLLVWLCTYHNHISLRRDFLSSLLRRHAEGSTVCTGGVPLQENRVKAILEIHLIYEIFILYAQNGKDCKLIKT